MEPRMWKQHMPLVIATAALVVCMCACTWKLVTVLNGIGDEVVEISSNLPR